MSFGLLEAKIEIFGCADFCAIFNLVSLQLPRWFVGAVAVISWPERRSQVTRTICCQSDIEVRAGKREVSRPRPRHFTSALWGRSGRAARL